MNNIDDAMSELNALIEAAKANDQCKGTHYFPNVNQSVRLLKERKMQCSRCGLEMCQNEVQRVGRYTGARGMSGWIIELEYEGENEALEPLATEPL